LPTRSDRLWAQLSWRANPFEDPEVSEAVISRREFGLVAGVTGMGMMAPERSSAAEL
jgi:hypothetical protein